MQLVRNGTPMRPVYQQYGIAGFAFDFDGTLAVPVLDFAVMREKTLAAVSGFTNTPPPPDLPLMEQLHAMSSPLPPEEKKRFNNIAFTTIKRMETEAAARSALFPFVRPMLEEFKKRDLPFAIITRNCKEAVLTVFPDVADHCACLLTRDDVTRVKPHPEHLLKALEHLRIPAANIMMVGDHPMDVTVGKRANTLTAGVASGEASFKDLQDAQPTFVAESGEALMQYLGIL